MPDAVLFAFLGVVIAAMLGLIGTLVVQLFTKRGQDVTHKIATEEQRSVEQERAVKGLSTLVSHLDRELEREREDCAREIKELEVRCNRRLEVLKERLDDVKGLIEQ